MYLSPEEILSNLRKKSREFIPIYLHSKVLLSLIQISIIFPHVSLRFLLAFFKESLCSSSRVFFFQKKMFFRFFRDSSPKTLSSNPFGIPLTRANEIVIYILAKKNWRGTLDNFSKNTTENYEYIAGVI